MTPELEALASTVEALTGPDREVDLAIHNTRGKVFRWSGAHSVFDGLKDLIVEQEPQWLARLLDAGEHEYALPWEPDILVCPRYTASLDAAMTLVPEGWTIANIGQSDDGSWWAELRKGYRTSYTAVAMSRLKMASPALALVAAALRAITPTQTHKGPHDE